MEQYKLKEKILSAPQAPGVYLMRDRQGTVLYVGKANSLKKRLISYLGQDLSTKTMALMDKVAAIEFRRTSNEMLALLLESQLIHEFKPKYNISLKDDKSFPVVEISAEEFPAVRITRKKNNAASRYLGPYTNVKLLKSALKIIRLNFSYRSCRCLPKQSCIYHRINLCPAPCAGKISPQEYQRRIDDIVLILEGKVDLLIRKLTKSMQESALAGDFESAARKRDQITALSGISAAPGDSSYKNELSDLRDRLGLKQIPARIEGFDISNLAGKQAVGSMVSFYNGSPDKNNYRRFRIKSVTGIDDYKMLAEVLRRRYTRLLREKSGLPDLILIDGGKGHLLTVSGELAALDLHVPLIGIAKEKENIYGLQEEKARIIALPEGPGLNLIRRVRDEAHRFALAYHHLLRRKSLIAR
jgi:excinuclease ABC subunit C